MTRHDCHTGMGVGSARSGMHTFAATGSRSLADDDPVLFGLLERELDRQSRTLMMVAASSAVHPSVAACEGSPLINTTAEGYPGARFHAGSSGADEVERLAVD